MEEIHCVPCFNVSDWMLQKRQFRNVVVGQALPAVALLGIVFNAISVFVLSRASMRKSINLYLCALATSDAFVGLTALWLYSLVTFDCWGPFVSNLHSLLAPVMFPLSRFVQMCSVYFTLAAATDCFIATVCPSARMAVCRVRRSLLVICCICAIAFLYNVPHIFELEIYECFEPAWRTVISRLRPTTFRRSQLYYRIYYTIFYTVFMAVGPLLVLIIMNSTILIRTVSDRKRKVCMPNQQIKTDSTTITLLLVVFLFILCNLLSMCVNLIEMIDHKYAFLSYLIDISNLLVVINSSANFLIYIAFDDTFRRTLLIGSAQTGRQLEILAADENDIIWNYNNDTTPRNETPAERYRLENVSSTEERSQLSPLFSAL